MALMASVEAEGQRAIGADAAVAHDLERLFAGPAASQAVARIRQPVFVKRAGKADARGEREKDGEGVRAGSATRSHRSAASAAPMAKGQPAG